MAMILNSEMQIFGRKLKISNRKYGNTDNWQEIRAEWFATICMHFYTRKLNLIKQYFTWNIFFIAINK